MPTHASLHLGNGGWCRFHSSDLPFPVYVRAALSDDERLEIVELYVGPQGGPKGITMIREIPLAMIETWLNAPDDRQAIIDRLDIPGPDIQTAAAHFASSPGKRGNWVDLMLASQVKGSGVTRPKAPDEMKDWVAFVKDTSDLALDLTLEVPEGGRYPDEFYRRVAELVGKSAAGEESPAQAIARWNDVPVTTVHRWVKEARRRGILPPGRRGKTG